MYNDAINDQLNVWLDLALRLIEAVRSVSRTKTPSQNGQECQGTRRDASLGGGSIFSRFLRF
jgi:hypothetical protein